MSENELRAAIARVRRADPDEVYDGDFLALASAVERVLDLCADDATTATLTVAQVRDAIRGLESKPPTPDQETP